LSAIIDGGFHIAANLAQWVQCFGMKSARMSKFANLCIAIFQLLNSGGQLLPHGFDNDALVIFSEKAP
jgi:hypothetical protein